MTETRNPPDDPRSVPAPEVGAALAAVLACPRCGRSPLAQAEQGLRCRHCRIDFPQLGDVACLYPDPHAELGAWRGRLHAELRRLQHEARSLDDRLRDHALPAAARQRLETLRDADRQHHDALRDLLAPLLAGHPAASHETYAALGFRPIVDQGLTTYEANVHRDWCWGDEENARALELVTGVLPAGSAPKRLLVLGAGAGRLARDLHAQLRCTLTVALDFNPWLTLIAARMFRGETLAWHEFPIAPRTLADQAPLRTLQGIVAPPGLVPMLGDALQPPFAPGSFDAVLTPWAFDILPDPPAQLAVRMNRLLAPQGHWLNFGSLAFSHADPALRLSLEETLTTVQEAGFGAPDVIEAELPYLCSPASRHGRREQVVAFCAQHQRTMPAPPRPRPLPAWLAGREPVPRLPHFEFQSLTTRVHLLIMELIDGRRSIAEMAKEMEARQLMPRAEAEPAIRSFLQRLHEDSERERRY